MQSAADTSVHGRLAQQSLGRPLTAAEHALSDALEETFKTGCHDFDEVAQHLRARGLPRPSGQTGPWTTAVLEAELALINASLDRAYVERGSVE